MRRSPRTSSDASGVNITATGVKRLARRTALSVAALWWMLAPGVPAAQGAEAVARVVDVRGEANARLPDGESRSLQVGSAVRVSDRVTTGRNAQVRIGFDDNTQVHLGAQSEFVVDQFERREEEAAFVATVGKGVFRVVTGLIAKLRPQSVKIITPVSTIGIRGTNFGGEVTASSATIVLLEPETAGQRTGIEVYNDYGRVTIEEPGYGTDVPDAQSPPSPPRRMQIRAIENLMRTLTNIQRIQIPRGGPR